MTLEAEIAHLFERHAPVVAAGIAGFVAFELLRLRSGRGEPLHGPSVASNLVSYGIGSALRLATRGLRVGAFVAVDGLTPLAWPTTALTVVLAYLAIDLTLYVWHRGLHEVPFLWAFHSVHHSSERYDLSLGGRVSWLQRVFDDLVYLPVVAFGVPASVALVLVDFNRLSQLWTHSSTIGRLPWLDGWLDTPSNHRVHHRRTQGGRARNYGSNFVIWDRLFGTYEREEGPAAYGTELGDVGVDPVAIQLAGLRRLFGPRGPAR